MSGIIVVAMLASISRTRRAPSVRSGRGASVGRQHPDTKLTLRVPSGYGFSSLAALASHRPLSRPRTSRERPRLALVLTGTALLVIAALFKQTAVVFIFIPALSMVGSSFHKRVFVAAIPIVGVSCCVRGDLAISSWFVAFHGGGAGSIPCPRFADRPGDLEFLTSLSLFLLALVHWLFTDARETWRLPRVRWLMAALICTGSDFDSWPSPRMAARRFARIPALLQRWRILRLACARGLRVVDVMPLGPCLCGSPRDLYLVSCCSHMSIRSPGRLARQHRKEEEMV